MSRSPIPVDCMLYLPGVYSYRGPNPVGLKLNVQEQESNTCILHVVSARSRSPIPVGYMMYLPGAGVLYL